MKPITGTVAAVTAAAAITGGVAFYNTATDGTTTRSATAEIIDDVHPVTVDVPRVSLPTVALPGVTAVTVATPAVNAVRTVTDREAATLELPEIENNLIVVPTVSDPAERMPQLIAIRKEIQRLFRDQRNLLYDTGLGVDSPYREKWLQIYRSAEYCDYVMEYKPLSPGLRIINEAKCPADSEEFAQLLENLEYYTRRGYNAVLVTFDTTEELPRLYTMVDYLKSAGLKVVIAYAGAEKLQIPIFRDPDRLGDFLATLGAKADALLLGWRRSSLHLFLPDKQWTAFLVKSARKRNSELAVIGTAYFGETAETPRGVTYDLPENASAVLIVGLGYPRVSTKKALQELFPEVMVHPHKIGLVVGEQPYFDSLHSTGRTKAENDATKRRVEIRLLQAGFESTMTYSGDGSDGQYGRKDRTENLCRKYGTE